MGLLNYTTKIDPDKTAQEIAKCLSMHGASAELTEYSPENSYVSNKGRRAEDGLPPPLRLEASPCDPYQG